MRRAIAQTRRQLRALTLIECIVAVVIISIAVPSSLWAMRDAAVQRLAPIQASKARWLITEKLEDVIADRHGNGYVSLGANGTTTATESSITGFSGFTRTTTRAEVGATLAAGGTGYQLITVTVSWTDSKGQSRSLSASSVVTDY
jgi:prepilin-type N-terminal cleavage/methylation domain-containing protein